MVVMATQYDDVLTIAEAAEQLQCAPQTIRNLVAMDRLETVETRFGRLITRESVREYQQKRSKPGRPPKFG
jgi:excisionase family DNA binding protein